MTRIQDQWQALLDGKADRLVIQAPFAEWQPVSTQPPRNDAYLVTCCTDSGDVFVGCMNYVGNGEWWDVGNEGPSDVTVTHWAMLPPPALKDSQ